MPFINSIEVRDMIRVVSPTMYARCAVGIKVELKQGLILSQLHIEQIAVSVSIAFDNSCEK